MAGSEALLITNARVLTMDDSRPRAEALLAIGGRIEAVGTNREVLARAAAVAAGSSPIDLRGLVVVPGFIDAHIHLLAAASRLLAVDCGPDAVASIDDIKARLRQRAAETPPGEWLRAAGFDELTLAEKRHPTRADLDDAAPGHPVRLVHRTGHALVLNSLGLTLAGIDGSTPEPPGGYMERDLATGEPTGFLVGMDDLVDRAVPPLPYAELSTAAEDLSHRLVAAGITWVEDASAANGASDWQLLRRLIDDGRLRVGVSMMEGVDHLGEVPESACAGRLRRGGVKVMPRELEDEVHPGPSELAAILRRIDQAGRQAAVHAIGRPTLDVTLKAFESLGRDAVLARRHRIEHAAICNEATAARIAGLGLTVVTQPGFVYFNGDYYRQRVDAADQPHLYPLRRLIEAGVPVAGSSDAPVAPFDVLTATRAAVERQTRSGQQLAPHQAVDGRAAVELYTAAAARAAGLESERGSLRPGLAADFVVLSADPTAPDVVWAPHAGLRVPPLRSRRGGQGVRSPLHLVATVLAGDIVSGSLSVPND